MKIELSEQSIDALAEVISGGSANESAPSIEAWRLEAWFKTFGLTVGSQQESRLPATKTAIREAIFIDNDALLTRIIESAADPRDVVLHLIARHCMQ